MGFSLLFAALAGAALIQAQSHVPGVKLNTTTVSPYAVPAAQETTQHERLTLSRCNLTDIPQPPAPAWVTVVVPSPPTTEAKTIQARELQTLAPRHAEEGDAKKRYDHPPPGPNKIVYVDASDEYRPPLPYKDDAHWVETFDDPPLSPVLPAGWKSLKGNAEIYGAQLQLWPDDVEYLAYTVVDSKARDVQVTTKLTIKKGLIEHDKVRSAPAAGVFLRVQQTRSRMHSIGRGLWVGISLRGYVFLNKIDRGLTQVLAKQKISVYEQREYTLKVLLKGSKLTVWLDNMARPAMRATVPGSHVKPGLIGVVTKKSESSFNMIEVKKLDRCRRC